MPTLEWLGKKAVLNHHREVPYRLLKCNAGLSAGDAEAGNLLVQGDNLEALKALLPHYAGHVKCLYLDPPYNTGVDQRDQGGKRTGWKYDDNVNSPEIRAWLHKVVGSESDDLSRHDKWLCMLYPRLVLLKQFLRPEGVVFVSIDDIEMANLSLLLDEVFGRTNRVGTIIWKNATDNNPTRIAVEHEYVLCYARDSTKLAKEWKAETLDVQARLLEIGERFVRDYETQDDRQKAYTKWFSKSKAELWPFEDYKFIDAGGIYTGMRSVHNPGKEGYRYDVVHPVTKKPCKQPLMGYRFPLETMDELLEQKRIIFGNDETKLVELKVYVKDFRAKLSSLFELDGRVGTNQIKELFPDDRRPFDFPKPTGLIEELLSFTTSEADLILDSFAGSGTTAHAVASLNKADGGSRKFILVEMDEKIAVDVTAERVRRVMQGYKNTKGETVRGLGGGFRFCTLDESLFDPEGHIRKDVSFAELARFVFFMETGSPMPAAKNISLLLGSFEGRAVYLLFNGILKDRSTGGGNTLTYALLAELPAFEGPKVMYGARCLIGAARLRQMGIAFKQLPYELKVER